MKIPSRIMQLIHRRIFLCVLVILSFMLIPLNRAGSPIVSENFQPSGQALTKTLSGYSYFHDNDGYTGFYGESIQIGHEFDFYNEEWRGWAEWDISDIPESANITAAGLRIDVTGIPVSCDYQRAQLDVYQMTNQPSLSINDPELLFLDAGSGLHLRENVSYPLSDNGVYPTSTSFITLDHVAIQILNASTASGWFAVGFSDYYHSDLGHDSDQDEGVIFEILAFEINYTEGGQAYSQNFSQDDPSGSGSTTTETSTGDGGAIDPASIIIIVVTIVVILIAVGITQKRNQNRSKSSEYSLLHSSGSQAVGQKQFKTKKKESKNRVNEKKLLKKFKSIMEISQRISIESVATSLEVTEKQLFELLLKWKKSLPVIIDGDFILINDITEFVGALDQEFSDWDSHQKTKDGKV
ncbi:hypothetical protein [Candidatus Lokiarchaeum ossiferum]|uniref:hypothetical protein n=1 Tax=Candidatus Lokiarchaeum ossiferum TaxID=2951803 RepID=UPI00352EC05C